MRNLTVCTLLVILGGLFTAAGAEAGVKGLLAPTGTCAGQTQQGATVKVQMRAMSCLANYARKKRGLAGLKKNGRLQLSAQKKARDILACNEFSHTACGRPFDFWIRHYGFTAGASSWSYAENILWMSGSPTSPRRAMLGWLRSPSHRRALLERDYRLHGLGRVSGNFNGHSGAVIWVHHLGRRG